MSFKFPSFNLQSIQDSLAKVDLENITKSISNVHPGKTVQSYSDQLKESIQPFTEKTTQLISSQLQQVQQLAATHTNSNIEISELPADYLELENHCDLLLQLYTDLIQFSNDTYGKVSYDYPPGNNALSKIRDANVGSIIGNKFTQLKNVSSPQELENLLLGGGSSSAESKSEADLDSTIAESNDEHVDIQLVSAKLPKTLFGQLSQITLKHGEELKNSSDSLSFSLLQISSTYLEIANARLDQDTKIMKQLNQQLVSILNEQFIKVNELRKKVYAVRLEFDYIRSLPSTTNSSANETEQTPVEDEENEELIAKEDELVSATEVAVTEMKKLIKPSKNINLLKVFVSAQKEWFDLSSKKLGSLLDGLDKVEINDDDDDDFE